MIPPLASNFRSSLPERVSASLLASAPHAELGDSERDATSVTAAMDGEDEWNPNPKEVQKVFLPLGPIWDGMHRLAHTYRIGLAKLAHGALT